MPEAIHNNDHKVFRIQCRKIRNNQYPTPSLGHTPEHAGVPFSLPLFIREQVFWCLELKRNKTISSKNNWPAKKEEDAFDVDS